MTNDSEGSKRPPALLTVSEVAQLMRVSKMTVYRLIDEHRLETIKIAGSFRVRRDDVLKFLKN
jgi:excisionase family DNA binding protein